MLAVSGFHESDDEHGAVQLGIWVCRAGRGEGVQGMVVFPGWLSTYYSLQILNTQPKLSSRQGWWAAAGVDVPRWISEGSDNVEADASVRRNGYRQWHDDDELLSLEAEALPRVDAGAGCVIRVRLQMDLAGMLSVHSIDTAAFRMVALSLIAVMKAVAWTDASYMCLIAWYTQHEGLLVQAGVVDVPTGSRPRWRSLWPSWLTVLTWILHIVMAWNLFVVHDMPLVRFEIPGLVIPWSLSWHRSVWNGWLLRGLLSLFAWSM
jgi:hypothetical protein